MDTLSFGFNFGHGSTSIPNLEDGFLVSHENTNTFFHPPNLDHSSTFLSPDSEEETEYVCYSNGPVIKYISDILMDEDLEDKSCLLQDSLALQAAEKSFYDVLNPKHPPSSTQSSQANQLLPAMNINLASEKESEVPVYNATNGSKGRKNRQREDEYYPEGRSNKQSTVSADDYEPQEMFDKVLLCQGEHHQDWESCMPHCSMKREETQKLQHNWQTEGSKTNLSRRNKDEEGADLTTMLNQCAQAVASYDQGAGSELLKKIRQHSSPYGHPTQRLAHYFANGLEARLNGTRTASYSPLLSKQTPAAEILQAYKVYITSSPFQMMAHFFANRTIMKLAKNETRLHIIHFGISYGFQWPCLIQHLSNRPNGPPKLHITAIELPQPGFQPTERVEETGRRLARYCAKFNVPFEYDVIAQKWETIQCEDLKIDRNELVVVNCLHRLRHIHDDTVMENSARDAVLRLIKNINPALFIHGIANGTYNTPFFATRFKEALLHYYAVFDMYETTIPRADKRRMMFEREIYGNEIMNVIACEGLERFERPETYKKWQIRNVRAGFKQLPLEQEQLKKVKNLLKLMGYHKDFTVEEDGQWMLQGWKGRIIVALSFWIPA